MRFTAPFIYSGSYVPARARSAHSVPMVGSTVIDVQEVAPGLAKLAFEVGASEENEYLPSPFPKVAGKPPRVWRLDGDFYCERFPVEEFQSVLDEGMDDKRNPFAVLLGGDGRILCFIKDMETKERTDVEREHPKGLRSWDESDREKEAALIARRTADLRIIDGMLCSKVSEPCLGLIDFAVGEYAERKPAGLYIVACESDPARASAFMPRHHIGRICAGRRWRIDRKDEVLALARSIGEDKGVDVFDMTEIDHVERELVTFSDDSEAVLTAANSAAIALKNNLAALPREIGLAWYALQDALDESPDRVTPELLDALEKLDALSDGSEIKTIHPVPYSIYHAVSSGDYGKEDSKRALASAGPVVREAVNRWRSRPDDGLEWAERGLKLNALPSAAGDVFEVLSMDEALTIGRKMRVDLGALAEAARDGLGHLVVSMSKDTPAAAALCVRDSDGFRIAESMGPLGRAAAEASIGRISEFLDAAGREADDDMALENLGALQLG